MTRDEQLQHDLDYIAAVVRRHEQPVGTPSIYFLWALLILVGFALPDFRPKAAGAYWLVAGIGGGLLSMWLGSRDARRSGIKDAELGRRYDYHWLIAGIGFLLCALTIALRQVDPAIIASGNFLLVAGLSYAFAGVHLDRPMLWSGLLMLAAYVVLIVFAPPYTWSITGVVIALSLLWAGLSAQRARKAGALR